MTGRHVDIAETLHRAYLDAEPIEPVSLPADLTVEEGYAVQNAFVDHRIEDEGPVVGYKIGFTSEAVQSALGVEDPAYGRILADTVRRDRRFELDRLIEPRIEPEIAFLLEDDLRSPVSRLDVAAATRFVVPAIEIVDSRIRDWDVTGPTAIADNALAARLLLGDRTTAVEGDLSLEGVEVLINGERRATGTGAAVLGHPADAVAWLAETLSGRGDGLGAGDIVTTGSITEPLPVAAGDTATARFSSLGTVVSHAKERE